MSGAPNVERLTRAYGLLLRLYSARFRHLYGPGMIEAFRMRAATASGQGRRALAFWVFVAVADVLWNAPQERFASWRELRGGMDAWPAWMARDVRFALRQTARQPALSVTLVLTLGIGTGAVAAFFGVVDAALLRPLPYPDADELLLIRQVDPEFGPQAFAPPYLRDLEERVTSLDQLAGFSPSWTLTLTGTGEPRLAIGAYVSRGLPESLGTTLLQGRGFEPVEHAPDGPAVVLVSRAFWDRQFGPDVPLDGQAIELDGEPHTVVGVAEDLRLPITSSLVSRGDDVAEVWIPFARNEYAELRTIPVMNVIGRLPDATALSVAAEELTVVARDLPDPRGDPVPAPGPALVVDRLADVVTSGARATAWTLFAAAAFLLLVACANVANLLLARGAARRTELAVRRSLGAARRRIVAQLLIESLVIALLGGAVGLALAAGLLEAVGSSGLPGLPPSAELRVDGRLAAFAAFTAFATVFLFGIVPAVQATDGADGASLRSGRRTVGGERARRGLVTAQVALAVTLLVGAGLLGRSLWKLLKVDPGFRTEGVLAVPLPMSGETYGDASARLGFLTEALESVGSVPGVEDVGAVNRLPLSGGNVLVGVEAEDVASTGAQPPLVDRRVATAGYFGVMDIAVSEGRDFDTSDQASSAAVAIVNGAFARDVMDGLDPLGRRVRLMLRSGPGPWLTVVGIAADVRHHGLNRLPEPEIYVPYAQAPVESMVLVAHTTAEPAALVPAARAALWSVDSDVPLDGAAPLAAVVRSSVQEPRFRAFVLVGFATLALLLAAVGVYGVMSYTVAQRTRETGVRVALGAQRIDVMRHVVGEGLASATLGLVLGLGGGILVSRVLTGFLFGVTPLDAPTFLVVGVVVMVVALVASYLPARRAARIDPVQALASD